MTVDDGTQTISSVWIPSIGLRSIPPAVAARTFDMAGTPLVSKVPLQDLEALSRHWGVSIHEIDKAMAEFERISTSPLNRALVEKLLPGALAKS